MRTQQKTKGTALIIGAHVEEIEAELALAPQVLVSAGWRVVILNPIGGWNWLRLRSLNASQLQRFKKSCFEAARVLGAEKIILDYDIGALPGCTGELTRDMALAVHDVAPDLVFIPWARDTHSDHRYVAQISFNILQGIRVATLTGRGKAEKRYEVWAYPAGISQSYNFWPDAVIAADPGMIQVARKANNTFAMLDPQKKRSFTENVKRKSRFWSVYSDGRPADAVKFVGPEFPLSGTLLKKTLGGSLLPVSDGPVLCKREYME